MTKEEILQGIKDGSFTDEAELIRLTTPMNNDDAMTIIKEFGFKVSNGKILDFFRGFTARNPEMVERIRGSIKVSK